MPTIIPTSPENDEAIRAALVDAAGDEFWRVQIVTSGTTRAYAVDDDLFDRADLPDNTQTDDVDAAAAAEDAPKKAPAKKATARKATAKKAAAAAPAD